jgi:hypothetical protein
MKAVVMRVEIKLQETGGQEPSVQTICCTAVGEGPEFTPTPGSITTVSVNLPVEAGFNEQTGSLSLDLIGLSVLEDGVPVPAATGVREKVKVFEGGEEGEAEGGAPRETETEVQPPSFVERPAMQQGQPQTAEEGKGDLALMDVVWNPAPGTLTPRPPHPPLGPGASGEAESPPLAGGVTHALSTPALAFAKDSPARIRGRDALVPLTCDAATTCKGVVELQSAPASGRSAAPAPATAVAPGAIKHKARTKAAVATYAKGSFDIPAHSSRTVTLRLSRAGRRLVRERRRVGLWINVTLTGSLPTRLYSRATRLTF